MTIKALTGLVPEWYIPEDEREASEPARFLLKALNAPQVAKLQGEFKSDTGEVSGVGLYEAAKAGVVDWENVIDHDDKPLKFSRRNFDVLPYAFVLELGGQVLANSLMTDEDEKNS